MTGQVAAPDNLTGTISEGTWDEIREHAKSQSGWRLRVEVPGPATTAAEPADKRGQPTGFGRFAGLLGSEDVIRNKREDLELEERRR